MLTFSSIDLQKQTGDVQRAATQEGAVITAHGKPRNVMLSVEEFCRLKRVAGEPIPVGLLPRKPVVVRHLPDPLGYDVSDFEAVAQKMADEAISEVNDDAVEAELDAVRQKFPGLHR
ncbi:type II toxin-antitoxin system Phd/YefM family antitoxin [Pararhizobium sp. LjRoot238]|uniref:type II toxin-antitoxin system Phd/YefM family antitoxin n=1 Tax=Pararhizobium sp. LjRoot238 TaxID=3342293 RepID=UPI003ED00EDB